MVALGLRMEVGFGIRHRWIRRRLVGARWRVADVGLGWALRSGDGDVGAGWASSLGLGVGFGKR